MFYEHLLTLHCLTVSDAVVRADLSADVLLKLAFLHHEAAGASGADLYVAGVVRVFDEKVWDDDGVNFSNFDSQNFPLMSADWIIETSHNSFNLQLAQHITKHSLKVLNLNVDVLLHLALDDQLQTDKVLEGEAVHVDALLAELEEDGVVRCWAVVDLHIRESWLLIFYCLRVEVLDGADLGITQTWAHQTSLTIIWSMMQLLMLW